MGLTTKGRIPQFQGNLRAVVPTPTFSGRLTDDPADSINPNTGSGPGTGGSGVTFAEISGVGATDPNFSDVAFLLNYDATPFADASNNTLTITQSGGSFETSTVKFGAGAFNTNGTGFIQIGDDPVAELSNNDWTFETWINFNAKTTGTQVIWTKPYPSNSGFGTILLQYQGTNNDRFTLLGSSVDSQWNLTPSTFVNFTDTAPAVGVWAHIAVTCENGVIRLFQDGNLNTTYDSKPNHGGSPFTFSDTGSNWRLGKNRDVDNANIANCIYDDTRLTVGTARYTASFTPPTSAFPTS